MSVKSRIRICPQKILRLHFYSTTDDRLKGLSLICKFDVSRIGINDRSLWGPLSISAGTQNRLLVNWFILNLWLTQMLCRCGISGWLFPLRFLIKYGNISDSMREDKMRRTKPQDHLPPDGEFSQLSPESCAAFSVANPWHYQLCHPHLMTTQMKIY